MTAIFAPSRPGDPLSPSGWIVDGRIYRHTAARFWSGLLREVHTDYPNANRIALSGLSEHPLDPDWLTPEKALERVFERWIAGNSAAALKETIQELTLLGPPTGVCMTICEDQKTVYDGALPIEVVDEEIFLYLLVWLLEWAAIPHVHWEQSHLAGSFTARAPDTPSRYRLDVDVVTHPAREGLLERHVTIQFTALMNNGQPTKS